MMDYEPGTTNLGRTSPKATRSRRTARCSPSSCAHGVKFHNGREMTAADVKYSLDRVTNPETQSPGAGFFGAIAGYRRDGGGQGHDACPA